MNKLHGKTIIWDGDSICAGAVSTGNWATRIAAMNGMRMKNYSRGGGTVAEHPPRPASGGERHSVSATLEKMHEEFPDADYIILEGGTNDADLLGNALKSAEGTRLGTVDPDDYSGEYDRDTFCGALESIFWRATQYWPGKKIAYIIAQKMGVNEICKANRRLYFDHAAVICKKWGIPCLDLWHGSYLNPRLPWMHDKTKTPEENRIANTGYYIDGQHLTALGYDVTADIIDSFLKTL